MEYLLRYLKDETNSHLEFVSSVSFMNMYSCMNTRQYITAMVIQTEMTGQEVVSRKMIFNNKSSISHTSYLYSKYKPWYLPFR